MKRTPQRQKAERVGARQAAPWQPSVGLVAALLLAVVAMFALIRFHLRDIPLERDEGEYAYAGQLILQGFPPYQLAYNMKLPGTYAAYALIMSVLGQTPAGIHLGLLLANAGTIVLMYFLAARLFGRIAGLVAAASYGLLSVGASVLGLAGHATHFVVLPALAGLLVLLAALERKRGWLFFVSGVLLGLAFVMKQPGIFFTIFGGVCLLQAEWTRPVPWKNLLKRSGPYSLGASVPFGLVCLLLWQRGVFQKFWFWTYSYARHYGSSPSAGFEELLHEFPRVVEPAILVWLMAAVGLTAFWWDPKTCRHRLWSLEFLVFSFLAVCLGFVFTSHYFILLLPAVSLLVGVAVSSATSLLEGRERAFLRFIPGATFVIAFAVAILGQRQILFLMNPTAVVRSIYHRNPFPEAIRVAEYLRSHSDANARIAVLGSEPEIYFYAHRHSATGYIYTYALMEEQPYALTMQREMIAEIESSRPEFIVMVKAPTSWRASAKSDMGIFTWMQGYIADYYERVGVVDIQGDDHTEYRWDADALAYQPRSPYAVYVFRRKG